MKERLLSVIILQYNGIEFTENLFNSIVKYESNNLDKYVFYLADNASTGDDGFEKFKINYPFINFIKNEKNYGFAVGVNRVASLVNTPYTLLLNNDIILTEDSINQSLNKAIQLKADAITCKMIDGNEGIMNNWSSKPSSASYVFFNFPGLSRLWRYWVSNRKSPSRVYYINGGFLLMKTSIFKEVGMFTERFFMYTEDLELMIKFNKKNARMYYNPGTSLIHFDGKSAETVWTNSAKDEMLLNQALTIYKEENSLLFFKIHKFLWMIQEFVKFKMSKNIRNYYRYSYLLKYKG